MTANPTSEEKNYIAKGVHRMNRVRILYIMKILNAETDEEHGLSTKDIIDRLGAYGIEAERKSIYSDINDLIAYGMDIKGYKVGRAYYYHVVNREFESAELKLLVDCVMSSKFVTKKKSQELVKKIENFTSAYEARKLDRQVNVSGRVKAMNERIYYSVDAIYAALSNGWQISFKYFVWNTDKQMEFKRSGRVYNVSPWTLCFDDEKYYLVAFDNDDRKIKHFRVDKMVEAEAIKKPREGKPEFDRLDMNEYQDRLFGMFDGYMETVKLLCDNNMANVIIDRFGLDIPIIKVDDSHFEARVRVNMSDMFLGWVMGLEGVKVVAPESAVKMLAKKTKKLSKIYPGT